VSINPPVLLILGHNPVQRIAHIRAYIFIPVLVQTERARRVLHEQVQETCFVRLELGEFVGYRRGYEVGAATACGECELFLEPGTPGGWGD
jgi:hypothetical protein